MSTKTTARKPPAVKPGALSTAAAEVARQRDALAVAVARRNKLMVRAKAGGMSVADVARATGLASGGAANAAMATVEG